jgi:hypothetical protein
MAYNEWDSPDERMLRGIYEAFGVHCSERRRHPIAG